MSKKLIRSFLKRNKLALRSDSCHKAVSLEQSIKVARGYHKNYHKIISDKTGTQFDPVFGRFKLDRRCNKDEVFISFHN